MLAMKKYDKKYIDSSRKKIESAVKKYKKALGREVDGEFEHSYFNNLILVMEYMFVHRMMGVEGKDGNPLNEVRVICNSLLFNDGNLQVEKLLRWPNSAGSGIKLSKEKSILKLEQGDPILLTESTFTKISKSFFEELEKKFS